MSDPFIGEIRLFGFPRVPTGWFECNGQSLSVSNYDTLYAVIGTTYGGDGVQSFNVPDLQGRVAIGQGTGPALPNFVLGQPGGEEGHTLTEQEMPIHSHALMSSTTTANNVVPGQSVHLGTASTGNLYAPFQNAAPYAVMAPSLSTAGQSLPHDNMMPTVVGNYCICAEGVFPTSG